MSDPEPHLSPGQQADISALADGSLDLRRREAVHAWVASSPVLQDIYRRQRVAITLLDRVHSDRAPLGLRTQVERALQKRRAPARLRFGMALAVPVVAAVVILALALPAGTPGAPSISQAAALAGRGPEQAAPAPDPSRPRRSLGVTVQGVYFPNWASSLGWRAVGMRRDRLGDRQAVTVYYARSGQHVAYTILAKPALPEPNIPARQLHGFSLQTLLAHGRTIVTWRRAGHTCVISGAGVPARVLDTLAAWR